MKKPLWTFFQDFMTIMICVPLDVHLSLYCNFNDRVGHYKGASSTMNGRKFNFPLPIQSIPVIITLYNGNFPEIEADVFVSVVP